MRSCRNCEKEFDTEKSQCPICGADLVDEKSEEDDGTEEIVAVMTTLGIL